MRVVARANVVLAFALVVGGCSAESAGREGVSASDGSLDSPALASTEGATTTPVLEALPDTDAGPGECGDLICQSAADCSSCPSDCGECPMCLLAPNCTGAAGIPTRVEALKALDIPGRGVHIGLLEDGLPASETTCQDPELRIRLRQIRVDRADTDNLYCVINATDGESSEIFISPLREGVSDRQDLVFEPTEATFWGGAALYRTVNNLTITYKCFKNTDNSRYTQVFDSIEMGARDTGQVLGSTGYGWAFGIGSVAAGLVSAAIGAGGDDLRIDAQQTIDRGAHLELTNGRRWEVRGEGEDWTWILEIEAWGCAAPRLVLD